MLNKTPVALLILTACAPLALADFSYHETQKLTGGMLQKFSQQMGNRMAMPADTLIAVKGNRMVRKSERTAQIIDLDRQTITTVNFDHQNYSVMTFQQMRDMVSQPGQSVGTTTNTVQSSVTETGQSKQVLGMTAKEEMLKITMAVADPTGKSHDMTVNDAMWMAAGINGSDELRAFYKKMSERMDWAPGMDGGAMGRMGIAKAFAEVYKQASKLNGMPLYQVISVSGMGLPMMGPAGGGAGNASLMEMTTEVTSTSTDAVDPSLFDIPAGYAQTENKIRGPRH